MSADGAAGGLTKRRAQPMVALAVAAAALLLAGCAHTASPASGLSTPTQSLAPTPDYANVCAPIGADTSTMCLRVTLQAIDKARASEGVAPMRLPADFSRLSVPEQLFVAVNEERVGRGLPPFSGLSASLDESAGTGADRAQLPPPPGRDFASSDAEWIGNVDNGLDADYQWMYDDGPGSGTPGCSNTVRAGCWGDRHVLLGTFGSRDIVMGAAFDPTGDTTAGDRGGSSLAATLAAARGRIGPLVYTWKEAQSATSRGTLQPLRVVPSSESDTGFADPPDNVHPEPDYTKVCGSSGINDSPACIAVALAAINHAHALEGVRPMVLPAGFAQLSVPEQLFVAINLERFDRGLSPFVGLTNALDENAQVGANKANDPPDPGQNYLLDDAEWAGGAVNGLDADYGWMYDDGYNSGNLDCTHRNGSGCWGHRKGILDDFGTGPHLVMGAAVDPSSDTHGGDIGGTSMAVTLADSIAPPASLTYTWVQVLSSLPAGAF